MHINLPLPFRVCGVIAVAVCGLPAMQDGASAKTFETATTASVTFDDEPLRLDESSEAELDGSLNFSLLAGAWIPRFEGNATLGSASMPNATRFDLASDFALDDMEPTVLPELSIRKREIWEMRFSGFVFSTGAAGTIDRNGSFGELDFAAGDAFRSDLDITSAAGELRIGMLRAYTNTPEANVTNDGRQKVDFRFAPIVGLRYVEVDHRVERLAGNGVEDVGGTWVVPYGGLRFELTYYPDGDLPLIHMLRLEAGAAAGPALGGDHGFAWQVGAGLTCQFTPNLGVMFGYRLLELDVENGAYEFDGGLQGLFLAASLRF